MRAPRPTLPELFDTAHHDLVGLRRRQYTLETLEHAIGRLLGETGTYTVHNDIVYSMILSSIDKNVIDFASWAKGLHSSGGLFFAIRSEHLAAFSSTRRWRASREDAHVKRHHDETYAAARERWFPTAAADLRAIDVSILQTHFQGFVDALRQDRNANRAHVFEHGGGSAKELELTEMRVLYDEAHKMLNDLRLVAFGSTFQAADRTRASAPDTIGELLEIMLVPPHARRTLRDLGTSAADFLTALSAAPPEADGEDFNSLQAVDRELERRGLQVRGR